MKGKKTGGRRAGTPNRVNQEIKDLLNARVDFGAVVDRLFELTQGVEVEQTGSDGESRIFSKPPDANAAKILLEYGFGKPSQSIEVSTPSGIQITRRIIDPANKS